MKRPTKAVKSIRLSEIGEAQLNVIKEITGRSESTIIEMALEDYFIKVNGKIVIKPASDTVSFCSKKL